VGCSGLKYASPTMFYGSYDTKKLTDVLFARDYTRTC
jgi:hypothetical protein